MGKLGPGDTWSLTTLAKLLYFYCIFSLVELGKWWCQIRLLTRRPNSSWFYSNNVQNYFHLNMWPKSPQFISRMTFKPLV